MRSHVLQVAAGFVLIAAAACAIAYGPVGAFFELHVGIWQNKLARYVQHAERLDGIGLYLFALVGGFFASLSPCILGMLPVNLSYIGGLQLRSRREAVVAASSFVAGVVVVNSIFGLLSSAFFAVLVVYRAWTNLGVGLLALMMAAWMLGLIRFTNVPSIARIPAGLGSFGVGLLFALVASPCASPVLVTVLAVAAQSGDPLRAVGVMVLYSLGYTAVLFVATLCAGIVRASRGVLAFGALITRMSATALACIGVFSVIYGVKLLVASP